MLNALEGVLSVLLIIALGFVLAKRNWFNDDASKLLARLVVSVALPAYMFANLGEGFTRESLLSLLPGLPIPFAAMVAGYLIALVIARALRIPAGRRGSFASMCALSNTIFIGLPVNLEIFGATSLSFVLLYYVANTTLFWTIGVHGIARDGEIREGRAASPFFSAQGLRRIFSPPLVAFLAAMLLIVVGISLPKPILHVCSLVGNLTTPLSMLFIGIVIAKIDWKTFRFSRELVVVCAARFLLAPALLLLLVLPWSLPHLMKQVFFVQAIMPVMTQTPILAKVYGADENFVGLGTALTTVASLVVIPVVIFLLDAGIV